MGGASAQVAFESEDLMAVEYSLYGEDRTVFSSSVMCYGLKEAMRRFVTLLIYDDFLNNNKTLREDIPNVCMQQGLFKDDWLTDFMTKKEDIHGHHCTEIKDAEFTEAMDSLPSGYEFIHKTAYNETKCKATIGSLFTEKMY